MTFGRRRRNTRTPIDLAVEDQIRVHERRASAARLVEADAGATQRILDAPPAYVLAHGSGDLARHAHLLDPLPSAREVRASATPGSSVGTWHLDIAARDRPGLLAAFTGVLVQAGLDVSRAVLADWEDGAALQALVVRSPVAPDVDWLQEALTWSLDQASSAPPVRDASLTFDHVASTAYTACEVVARDRPGLLHAIAVAIANAGVDIHAASATTVDGIARDRFDLSDRWGAKFDRGAEKVIAAGLRAGFSGAVASKA